MSKQATGTSNPLPEQTSVMNFIKMLALSDPHHMVESMQKLFPFATSIPGLDPARLTEIGESSFHELLNASTNVQQRISDSVAEESKLLQECIGETLQSLQQMSGWGNPHEVAAKQTEIVAQVMDKLSRETMEIMMANAEVMMKAVTQMKNRYVATLDEFKKMAEQSKT
jgi:hypothetical protein